MFESEWRKFRDMKIWGRNAALYWYNLGLGKVSMNYVLGFMFSLDKSQVALIIKNRPSWQAGKFNGIGGKILDEESPFTAMVREFKEEASYEYNDWEPVLNFNFKDARVFVFTGTCDLSLLKSGTDELIYLAKVNALPENVISNLRFLIPMCLEFLDPSLENH